MRDFDAIYKILAMLKNSMDSYEFDKLIFFKISFRALLSEAKNATKTNRIL